MAHARRFALLLTAALGGCATFPSSGPSASAVMKQAVRLETVTPEMATASWEREVGTEQRRISDTLGALTGSGDASLVRLYPGAKLSVSLWTAPQLSGVSGDVPAASNGSAQAAVARSELGPVTVDDDGSLALPYIGHVQVGGMTLAQARALLDQRFAATRKFQSPQVALAMLANAGQQIIVSGTANRPVLLDWREGGISLAEAITQAGGIVLGTTPGTATGSQDQARSLTANHVVIVRKGSRYELPVKTALESDIRLRPNDQVVLEHVSVIRIQCLGGGWPQNTVQSFDDIPTLSQVVASGGGLNAQQAQGVSVFVLTADRQTIYKIEWNTLAGLQAAQKLPLRDGDIVYIATAPSVRIQQITNILFSAAYPVTVAKAAF